MCADELQVPTTACPYCSGASRGTTQLQLHIADIQTAMCPADDLSSEDGGSPTAVKGLAELKESKQK